MPISPLKHPTIKEFAMNNKRRSFLKKSGLATLLIMARIPSWARKKQQPIQLTVLHSNDVHSQIDPFPLNHTRFPGKGGFARRLAYIQQIRRSDSQTLVFDSGDFFQGTPFFNFYKGKLEIELMNRMHLDAVTIGNHEFDNGLDMLAKRFSEANFPIVNANYEFHHPELKNRIKPYIVLQRHGVRIGIFGLGVQLDGLVNALQRGDTVWHHPVEVAQRLSQQLKQEERCDVVIALSHLGYSMSNGMDDKVIAAQTDCIDLILGGHTHTFLQKPEEVINRAGKKVWINQVGFSGVALGHLTLSMVRGNNDRFELFACEGVNQPMDA